MVGWFGRRKQQQRAGLRIHVTPTAHAQLRQVLANQPAGAVLRVLVKNPSAAVPEYDMALEAAPRPDDAMVELEGLRIVVDAAAVPAVHLATLDFVSDPLRPGFRIDPPPVGGDDPLAVEVRHVLEHQINPGIASHGGHAELAGIQDDVVYVALGGGCQGCSMASVTLKQGIEQLIKQAIPRVRAVVDVTDHAGGTNPFYTAAKGGESPFHQAAKA
ncbi:MAG: NifU family protein [Chloroflexi bacterium]|nr:NifU family protein [Chloroflexota bacterium]